MISGDTDSNPDFTIDNYAIHTGLFRLGRKTTRLYDDEAVPYEISEEYLYSDNLLYNMTGTLSCTSLGDSIYTRYYYPSDGYPGYPPNNMRPTFSAKSIDDSHCDRTNKNKRKQTIAYLWQESNIRLYSG